MKHKRELAMLMSNNDFDPAIGIRNLIKRLELRRDHFDAKYETSRFEQMIGVEHDPFRELEVNQRLLE